MDIHFQERIIDVGGDAEGDKIVSRESEMTLRASDPGDVELVFAREFQKVPVNGIRITTLHGIAGIFIDLPHKAPFVGLAPHAIAVEVIDQNRIDGKEIDR